ncbi:MAG TPA: nuclear transport factor 2 family protein [Kofleriaceae bacterium]|nr:nuclear transport factor 2 family protein [Kofleriaceae bacterium]
MFELAQALAVAKSRQDVPGALALMHPEMELESSFGTLARGLAENERALTRFFESFPDYEVSLQGHAGAGDTLVCWGVVRMTMTGNRFAMVLTARRTMQGTTASAASVAAFVAGGFWFTATDFANPAAAAARALTDTFAGIRPRDVPGFLVGETAGWLLALVACRGTRGSSATSNRVVSRCDDDATV